MPKIKQQKVMQHVGPKAHQAQHATAQLLGLYSFYTDHEIKRILLNAALLCEDIQERVEQPKKAWQ